MIEILRAAATIFNAAMAEWRQNKDAQLAARRAGEAFEREVGRALAKAALKERRKHIP